MTLMCLWLSTCVAALGLIAQCPHATATATEPQVEMQVLVAEIDCPGADRRQAAEELARLFGAHASHREMSDAYTCAVRDGGQVESTIARLCAQGTGHVISRPQCLTLSGQTVGMAAQEKSRPEARAARRMQYWSA
jgi:hypothetical protein